MSKWLKNAVFYEIYPQSFYDTNADGIGDIQGIIEKLDYIKNLGCNALWINPWYDSPFKDAGYDVRDYKKVAERYGTNEDAKRLFEEAHQKGIHVLLDLVPGHTSEEHEWFKESGKALKKVDGKVVKNEYSDRYIWSDFWLGAMKGHPYIGGECDRNGVYMLNFFKCQPALNYGFASPEESWQMSYLDEEPRKTLEAMMDVMRFWLDMGCDGFRVDMAESLVKDDDEMKSATCSLWKKVRAMLDAEYPNAAMVSEWSNPYQSLNSASFHMDFYLDHRGNGYNTLVRDYESAGPDNSYFKKDADGDITRFLNDYIPKYEATKNQGYICFMTCNHDTPRASHTLDESELKVAYAMLLTMPGVPFIYYGDEIGMKYIEDMPTKEGGYTRTGTRTPMQWNSGKNLGFSEAEEDKLYLPVDSDVVQYYKNNSEADNDTFIPVAESQMLRPDSLYNVVKNVLKLRHEYEDIQADGDFEVLLGEKDMPFVYRRGNLIMLVNPSEEARIIPKEVCTFVEKYQKNDDFSQNVLYSIGDLNSVQEGIKVSAQSFIILG